MPRQPDPAKYSPFGIRLEQVRASTDHGSQGSFARWLGTTPQSYSSWLVAKGHPSIEMLTLIRKKTGVDLNFLVAGEIPTATIRTLHGRGSAQKRA